MRGDTSNYQIIYRIRWWNATKYFELIYRNSPHSRTPNHFSVVHFRLTHLFRISRNMINCKLVFNLTSVSPAILTRSIDVNRFCHMHNKPSNHPLSRTTLTSTIRIDYYFRFVWRKVKTKPGLYRPRPSSEATFRIIAQMINVESLQRTENKIIFHLVRLPNHLTEWLESGMWFVCLSTHS